MFGEKLKGIRKKTGLSQRKLAALIGTTNNTIHRLEINQYPPSYPTLVALVEKAKVKPAELF